MSIKCENGLPYSYISEMVQYKMYYGTLKYNSSENSLSVKDVCCLILPPLTWSVNSSITDDLEWLSRLFKLFRILKSNMSFTLASGPTVSCHDSDENCAPSYLCSVIGCVSGCSDLLLIYRPILMTRMISKFTAITHVRRYSRGARAAVHVSPCLLPIDRCHRR